MERKALERLVSALLDAKHASNRVGAIEDALVMAQEVLWGEEWFDEDDFKESLHALSIQLLVKKLDREGLSIHRSKVGMRNENDEEEEVAQIFATTDPILASILGHTLDQCLKKPANSAKYDLN